MSHPLFDMAGIAQQVQHMQQFAAAASSGALKVDEAAGQPLINALNGMLDRIDGLRRQQDRVKQSAKLGTSPAAQVAIPQNVSMATGSDQSFDAVVNKLIEMAQKAKDGIQQAMDNYRNTEHGNQQRINRAGA